MTSAVSDYTADGEKVGAIIDDDSHVVRRVIRNLKSIGWHVVGFTDSVEALRELPGLPSLDALFVDTRMPCINGPEFYQSLDPAFRESIPLKFLCSEVRPNQDVVARIEALGARFMDKDTLCDKFDLAGVLGRAGQGGAPEA